MFGRLVTEKIVLGIYTWILCIEIFLWIHSKRFCHLVSENSVCLTSYKCFCRRCRPRGSFGFVVSGRNKSSQRRKPMVYDSKRFYYDRTLVQALYFPENRCSCRVLAVFQQSIWPIFDVGRIGSGRKIHNSTTTGNYLIIDSRKWRLGDIETFESEAIGIEFSWTFSISPTSEKMSNYRKTSRFRPKLSIFLQVYGIFQK